MKTLILTILLAALPAQAQKAACGDMATFTASVQSDRVSINGFALTSMIYGRQSCDQQLDKNLEHDVAPYSSKSVFLEYKALEKLSKMTEAYAKSCTGTLVTFSQNCTEPALQIRDQDRHFYCWYQNKCTILTVCNCLGEL